MSTLLETERKLLATIQSSRAEMVLILYFTAFDLSYGF